MVLPLVIAGAAASVAGGIANYLNSKEAASANAADIARLQGLLDEIKQPNFDFSKLAPADYQVAAKYVPQVAPYIAEQAPQTIKAQGEGATAGKKAQMDALQRLIQQSQSGSDVQQEIANRKAQLAAGAGAQANRAQLDELFARRGQLGSGLQYAGNLAGIADIQNQQSNAEMQAAVDAANRRMQATGQAANLGGDLYNQDTNLEKYNVGLINDFNQRQTGNQNAYSRYATGLINDANLQNTGRVQKVADRNVESQYDTNKYNQTNFNNLQNDQYNNLVKKLNLQGGITGQQMNNRNATTQQENQAVAGATGALGGTLTGFGQEQAADDRFQKTYDQNERINKAKYGSKYGAVS